MSNINRKNINSFIEGNLNKLSDSLSLLAKHKREQVAWRLEICKDCVEVGKCKYCNCSTPGKLYVEKSCNDGRRFPDMMDKITWEDYKKVNKIIIKS